MTSVPIGPEGSPSVILNGAGSGTVRCGPLTERETWNPATASVKCSTAASEAVCNIYQGADTTAPNFIDGTFTGSSGDSTDRFSSPLHAGGYIWAVWTGGDAGAAATLSVNGTKDV